MALFIGWLVVAWLMRRAYSTLMWLVGLVTLMLLSIPAVLFSLDPEAAEAAGTQGWGTNYAWGLLAVYGAVALVVRARQEV